MKRTLDYKVGDLIGFPLNVFVMELVESEEHDIPEIVQLDPLFLRQNNKWIGIILDIFIDVDCFDISVLVQDKIYHVLDQSEKGPKLFVF